MKKTIIRLLSVFLIFCVLAGQVSVFASAIDFNKKCSLTLTYSKNGHIFSDLEIKIYRVADYNLGKISPFDEYPVNIDNIKSQTEWNSVASTLAGYVQSKKITPYKTAKTDHNGSVIFNDIEIGLYLVAGVIAEKEGKIYTFYDNMVFVPTPSPDEYLYDLNVNPKSTEISVPKKSYSIVKLWKDNGSNNRPKSITVDILKNGAVVDTVTLNSSNNWQHTFETTDIKSDWSVVEKNIPSDYTVTVTEKETSFVIVNTKKGPTPPPTDVPDTGDRSPIELYIVMLCISGLLLIVLGIGIRRKEDATKK